MSAAADQDHHDTPSTMDVDEPVTEVPEQKKKRRSKSKTHGGFQTKLTKRKEFNPFGAIVQDAAQASVAKKLQGSGEDLKMDYIPEAPSYHQALPLFPLVPHIGGQYVLKSQRHPSVAPIFNLGNKPIKFNESDAYMNDMGYPAQNVSLYLKFVENLSPVQPAVVLRTPWARLNSIRSSALGEDCFNMSLSLDRTPVDDLAELERKVLPMQPTGQQFFDYMDFAVYLSATSSLQQRVHRWWQSTQPADPSQTMDDFDGVFLSPDDHADFARLCNSQAENAQRLEHALQYVIDQRTSEYGPVINASYGRFAKTYKVCPKSFDQLPANLALLKPGLHGIHKLSKEDASAFFDGYSAVMQSKGRDAIALESKPQVAAVIKPVLNLRITLSKPLASHPGEESDLIYSYKAFLNFEITELYLKNNATTLSVPPPKQASQYAAYQKLLLNAAAVAQALANDNGVKAEISTAGGAPENLHEDVSVMFANQIYWKLLFKMGVCGTSTSIANAIKKHTGVLEKLQAKEATSGGAENGSAAKPKTSRKRKKAATDNTSDQPSAKQVKV